MACAQQLHNDSDDEWKQVAELRAVAEAQDPACKVRSTIPPILSRSSISSSITHTQLIQADYVRGENRIPVVTDDKDFFPSVSFNSI
jgi:hypothetical protein